MKLNFKKLTLEDKGIYDKYLLPSHNLYGWENNFAMTYIWDAFDKTMICDLGDMALIQTVFFGETVFFPPLLADPSLMTRAVDIIKQAFIDMDKPFDLRGLTYEQSQYLDSNRFLVTTNRDNSDYIYEVDSLINLTGKKYHSKRNFISRFKNKYNYEIVEYNDKMFAEMMVLYDKWYRSSVHETLNLEKIVITRALKNYLALNLKILIVKVEGNIAGFSVSTIENANIAHTLFEKGDTSYDGIYQMINQATAQNYLSGIKYVNRQEDMGIEGLRKSKLSYNPILLVDKYFVRSTNEKNYGQLKKTL